MGKKIKKFLKKAAKAAIIGGAIYGATRLAKNRKKKALNIDQQSTTARNKNYGFDKSGSFTGEGLSGSSTVNTLSKQEKRKKWRHGNRKNTHSGVVGNSPFKINTLEETLSGSDKRGYGTQKLGLGLKKGGRVTGCAKRGFGRALKRK